jgi:hypothetical protein
MLPTKGPVDCRQNVAMLLAQKKLVPQIPKNHPITVLLPKCCNAMKL